MNQKFKSVNCPHCHQLISLADTIAQIEESLRTDFESELQDVNLNLKKKEKTIEDMKSKLDDMRKRIDASASSQQLSGAILQESLEQTLRNTHGTDIFTSNKVGRPGADLFQEVRTTDGHVLGHITYEIKNTQNFASDWLEKIRTDDTLKNTILIIATKAMPKEAHNKKFILIDNVWVCQISFIEELTLALRYSLIRLNALAKMQHGQRSKSEELYYFLNSEQGQSTWNIILNGYKKIKESYYEERVRVERLWAQRDLQLQEMLSTTLNFQSQINQISCPSSETRMLPQGSGK